MSSGDADRGAGRLPGAHCPRKPPHILPAPRRRHVTPAGLAQGLGARVGRRATVPPPLPGHSAARGPGLALQHDPGLVVLDEPGSSLDPASVILLRDQLTRRARQGAAVLVSSHHLDEVSRIADRVLLMNAGRLIGELDTTGSDLERRFFEHIRADNERRRERGSTMIAAVRVEALKLVRSLVGMIAALALVLGTVALLSGITFGVAGGNPRVDRAGRPRRRTELGRSAHRGRADHRNRLHPRLRHRAGVDVRPGVHRRDDHRIVRPAGRSQRIALAKLIVYTVWAFVVGTAMALGVLLLGVLFGYEAPSTHAWAGLGRLWALAMFSAGVAIPIAWIATWTRSLLGGVAGTVALVVITQIGALTGVGAWMPPAAPAIWAMSHGTRATALHLALTGSVAVVFGALTCWTWKRLQLDR